MKVSELVLGIVTAILMIISLISSITRLPFSDQSFFFSMGYFLVSSGFLLALIGWNRREQIKANELPNSPFVSKFICYGIGSFLILFGAYTVYLDHISR